MDSPSSDTKSFRYKKTVLPAGLTVVSEKMEHLRSATVGIWLKKGSRHESDEEAGISHFIEHLVFKGTERRSYKDIARTIDRTGGMTDASTSKEFATFSVKVMDEHLPVALDLLTDILTRPAFDPGEIENERRVIFEEIKSTQDNPDDYIGEVYYQTYFQDHPLGRSILGTNASVAALGRRRISEFFRDSYVPANLVVSAAGNVEHNFLVEYFSRQFPSQSSPAPSNGARPTPHPGRLFVRKNDLEQTHINIGFPGLHRSHEDRFALFLLNNMLGGSMSSRLFQNIREKWGLAYSIFSYVTSFHDVGTVTIYTAVDPSEVSRVVRLTMDEIGKLLRREIDQEELDDSKAHLKGGLMLGLESSSARMASLALNELYFGRQFTPEEVLESIERVTLDQMVDLARRLFRTEDTSLVILGGKNDIDLEALDLHLAP
ncbi:MAG: pitrilysin family protein [Acidobacteriota bacterium]